MGDRIEIKDSVIMGNVSTGGKSSSRSECSICKKIGRFNLHFCKLCNVYFCRDCRDTYWKDGNNVCIVCGTKEKEARVDFVNSCIDKLDGKTELLIGRDLPNMRFTSYSYACASDYEKINRVLSKISIEELKEIIGADSTISAKRACLELPRDQRWSTLELARIERDNIQAKKDEELKNSLNQKRRVENLQNIGLWITNFTIVSYVLWMLYILGDEYMQNGGGSFGIAAVIAALVVYSLPSFFLLMIIVTLISVFFRNKSPFESDWDYKKRIEE